MQEGDINYSASYIIAKLIFDKGTSIQFKLESN